MAAPVRIYLSFNVADAGVVEGLQKQLRAVFSGRGLELRDRSSLYAGAENALNGEAWLQWADLCIAVFSADYLGQDTSREWETAKRLERERRPALQILVAYARSAAIPTDFQAFPVAPSLSEPVQQSGFDRDRQLQRVAHVAYTLLQNVPLRDAAAWVADDLPLPLDIAQTHLLAASDRLNLMPQLALLKKIADDAQLKKAAYEMEDLFGETLRQGKLAKIPLTEYLQRNETVRGDFQFVVKNLSEKNFPAGWRGAFLQTVHGEAQPLALFTPTDDIIIPETLNLPVAGEGALAENMGLLSYQQKADFRRELLLAQDALSVENYGRAHSHCERVRTQIDPQSAQLYEYLLISFFQNETPGRVAWDSVDDEKRRLLNYIVLYANRLREYQQKQQCPSQTSEYNLRATAEELSNALCRIYDQLPNDYVLDTGKRASELPNNRAIVARCREIGEIVFRSVHPYTGFLEVLVLELCGGGKYNWVQRVEVLNDEFVFVSLQDFEIETSTGELVSLLSTATLDRTGVEQRLRQELLIRLKAKQNRLHRYRSEEQRRHRSFNDPRESVMQFIQSCLLGYNVFEDTPSGEVGTGGEFLRLALQQLIPGLVMQPDPEVPGSLRWFDLNTQGDVRAHPDCTRYRFDAFGVVEKIIRDFSGKAGWLQVQPNLKREVFRQFVGDTEAEYERVRDGLEWSDFRRMPDLDARRILVTCLRRWVTAYHAYPTEGQSFLEKCVTELTGSGLLNWLYFNPFDLVAHPDSLAFGYDAQAELKTICDLSVRHTEAELSREIVENLFQQRILSAYDVLRRGDEAGRSTVVSLLLQTLSGYRLHPDPRFLDFVFGELTHEVKFRWVNIGEDGQAKPWTFKSDLPFDPLAVLKVLADTDPARYPCLGVRERIAERRHADQMERYFQEISEFRQENRRPERALTIDILRKMRGIYRYYPKEEFLHLPIRELTGKGRIRWNALFLGFFPTRENHFENKFYHFNYRFELFELKRLLDQQYYELQRVMGECEASA